METNKSVFKDIDPEIISLTNDCKLRYLKNAIIRIVLEHQELSTYIHDLLVETLKNQNNDEVNDLLEKANLPCYPEHYTLKDFDKTSLKDMNKITYNKLVDLCFLNDDKKPNVFIHGLVGQGREKVAIGLGDRCCRANKKTQYVVYQDLINILGTHTSIARSNKRYDELVSANCLIIDGFAEENVYDAELLDVLTSFLNQRPQMHRESYILHKYNNKKPFIPCCTIVTSSFEPAEWTKYMQQDKNKTLKIAQLFYSSYAFSIHIDETNKENQT